MVRAYAIAILSTGLSAILWLILDPHFATSLFLLFIAAVALSAWSGGVGPALTAMGISTVTSFLLYVLPATPDGLSPKRELLFILTFLLVSLFIVALRVARQRAEEALVHQALHDSLTQLPNRLLFADRLEQAIQSAYRHDMSCAVLLLDLNGFKEINDHLGHAAGDLLLQQVSRRLEGSIRASDTVARWGGDEFALVLPDSDAAGTIQTVERIRRAFGSPLMCKGTRVAVTPSIGMALYPEHGRRSESLLMEADAAMYRCKRAETAGHELLEAIPAEDAAGQAGPHPLMVSWAQSAR